MIIISGGQTGADIAGLKIASLLGIPTTGYAARNFMTENGPDESLAKYFLIDEKLSYPQRTILNCTVADLTLLFVFDETSPGSKIVKKHAKKLKIINLFKLRKIELEKPDFCLRIEIEKIASQFELSNNMIVNIAGNRESFSPGHVERLTSMVLVEALNPFRQCGHSPLA